MKLKALLISLLPAMLFLGSPLAAQNPERERPRPARADAAQELSQEQREAIRNFVEERRAAQAELREKLGEMTPEQRGEARQALQTQFRERLAEMPPAQRRAIMMRLRDQQALTPEERQAWMSYMRDRRAGENPDFPALLRERFELEGEGPLTEAEEEEVRERMRDALGAARDGQERRWQRGDGQPPRERVREARESRERGERGEGRRPPPENRPER
ncbi:MAG: hypothetical protein EA425_15685 [Puniceicoccaceae bacterium]|nr:MAG: hypothetical protein EA425_15685 [Puniceicoccaceae bacterium]